MRNIKAFEILEKLFRESNESSSKMKVMDRLLGIFAANPVNFILLQHLHTLAHFIEGFESYDNELKV